MIELGSKVRDIVSGFPGIAVARTVWLYGCERISIQPPVGADGKIPDVATFDAPAIEVLEEPTIKVPASAKNPGGPRPAPQRNEARSIHKASLNPDPTR